VTTVLRAQATRLGAAPEITDDVHEDSWATRIRRALSIRSIGAIYIFLALFAIFSLWVPDTFLTSTTWRTLLDDQAVTAIAAVALVLPLAAGGFNLAIGTQVGLGSIFSAWLLASQGLSGPLAVLLAVLAGGVCGRAIGLLVVRLRFDSFIA
jgi:ribose transport system permease protein